MMKRSLHELSQEELSKLFPILISKHDPVWGERYQAEKELLLKTIGSDKVVRINHYGSTYVPGLLAKPTIDILLEVIEKTDSDLLIKEIKGVGYHFSPQPKNPPPHMMFMKGYSDRGFVGQAFHLHIRYPGDWDELYFRDYLVNNPDTACQYGQLKLALKQRFEYDRDGYTKAKTDFIAIVTKKARKETPQLYALDHH